MHAGDIKTAKAYLEFLLTKPVFIASSDSADSSTRAVRCPYKALVVPTYAAGAEYNTGITGDKTCIRSYLSCGSKIKASSGMHVKYITT